MQIDAEETILDLLAATQHVEDATQSTFERHGEAAGRLAASDAGQRGCQTDQFALQIEQCAAAATEVQAGIRLDERPEAVKRQPGAVAAIHLAEQAGRATAEVADNAPGRAGAAVAETGGERIRQRQQEVALAEFAAVAEFERLEVRHGIEQTQHGQIAARVRGVDVGPTAAIARQTNVNLGGFVNDVGQGEDQPLFLVEDHAAAVGLRHVIGIAQVEVGDGLIFGIGETDAHAGIAQVESAEPARYLRPDGAVGRYFSLRKTRMQAMEGSARSID